MAQTCKGICIRLKSIRSTNSVRFRYKLGQKYCSHCALFFNTEEISCPCCNTRLVQNPRVKDMTCKECNHNNGECECLCCCSIARIGCPTCVVPVLAY